MTHKIASILHRWWPDVAPAVRAFVGSGDLLAWHVTSGNQVPVEGTYTTGGGSSSGGLIHPKTESVWRYFLVAPSAHSTAGRILGLLVVERVQGVTDGPELTWADPVLLYKGGFLPGDVSKLLHKVKEFLPPGRRMPRFWETPAESTAVRTLSEIVMTDLGGDDGARTASDRYELFYSTGGHGGPYPSTKAAKAAAERLMAGGRDTWIVVVPVGQMTRGARMEPEWILWRGRDWVSSTGHTLEDVAGGYGKHGSTGFDRRARKTAAVPLKIKAGTRVVMKANPASRALYSGGAPADGTEGVVTPMNLGGAKRTWMAGPGGGLVYVEFDDGTFTGISPHDLERADVGKTANRHDGMYFFDIETVLADGDAVLGNAYTVSDSRTHLSMRARSHDIGEVLAGMAQRKARLQLAGSFGPELVDVTVPRPSENIMEKALASLKTVDRVGIVYDIRRNRWDVTRAMQDWTRRAGGSGPERTSVFHETRVGMNFPTEEARAKYLKDHPGADKSRHKIIRSKPDDFHPLGSEHAPHLVANALSRLLDGPGHGRIGPTSKFQMTEFLETGRFGFEDVGTDVRYGEAIADLSTAKKEILSAKSQMSKETWTEVHGPAASKAVDAALAHVKAERRRRRDANPDGKRQGSQNPSDMSRTAEANRRDVLALADLPRGVKLRAAPLMESYDVTVQKAGDSPRDKGGTWEVVHGHHEALPMHGSMTGETLVDMLGFGLRVPLIRAQNQGTSQPHMASVRGFDPERTAAFRQFSTRGAR